MKKLMFIAALAALATGCGVKKINYEKKVDNEGTTTYSYRIYQNDHWLNTKASTFKGGMDANGKFEFQGEGLQSSPSEEYNKMMGTTMGAFVQMMQIAAAAYNPSASAVTASKQTSETAQTQATAQTPAATEVQTVAAQTQAAAASSDSSQNNAE